MAIDQSSLSQRAAGDSRVPVALSSDNPIRTWYGTEILVHEMNAIDWTYAKNGLPFLLDHDVRQQIGWLEDLKVGEDGVLRAMAKQGANPVGGWVFEDMIAGGRPYISIGYDPLAWTGPSQDEDGSDEEWIITKWMPLEASSVAIPADPTVGVGRSAELAAARAIPSPVPAPAPMELTMTEEERRAAEAAERKRARDLAREVAAELAEEAAEATRAATATATMTEDARTGRDMRELMTLATQNNRLDLMPSWVERGISPLAARDELLSAKRSASGAAATVHAPAGHVDLDEKQRRQYSIVNAIRMQLPNAKRSGLEVEVSEEIEKRLGREAQGFFIPLNVETDPTRAKNPESTRTAITGQQVGTNADGGYGVQTEVQPLIELLRNRMVVKQLGATIMTGLSDTLQFPRQTSANTMTWVGENPATPNANTKAGFDIVTMSPKTGQIDTSFSRRLLAQNSFDVEQFVRNDITLVGAIGLDYVALNGSGSSNQPLGILNTSGVGSVAMGTNGGLPTWAKMVAFLSAIQAANADVGDFGWAFTPEMVADLLTIPKTTNQAVFLMDDKQTVINYKTATTNQLPKNLTKGTSSGVCHAAVLGVWPQLMIGEWGGAMDILVDPFTSATQNMINVHGFLMVDVGCRHPGSFCVSLDITP